jgi:hypothetical protein
MSGQKTKIASMDRDKAKVRAAIEARGLVSVMNETKWRELASAVEKLPFAPPFQIKDVLGTTPVPPSFEEDVSYCGDWGEGLQPYYSVEWIRFRPRLLLPRGNYASPQVEDIESAFVAILRAVGVPHRKRGDCLEIFGYTESTTGLTR